VKWRGPGFPLRRRCDPDSAGFCSSRKLSGAATNLKTNFRNPVQRSMPRFSLSAPARPKRPFGCERLWEIVCVTAKAMISAATVSGPVKLPTSGREMEKAGPRAFAALRLRRGFKNSIVYECTSPRFFTDLQSAEPRGANQKCCSIKGKQQDLLRTAAQHNSPSKRRA